MALLTLGKDIMTIENAKGPILVKVLFWVGVKKNSQLNVLVRVFKIAANHFKNYR